MHATGNGFDTERADFASHRGRACLSGSMEINGKKIFRFDEDERILHLSASKGYIHAVVEALGGFPLKEVRIDAYGEEVVFADVVDIRPIDESDTDPLFVLEEEVPEALELPYPREPRSATETESSSPPPSRFEWLWKFLRMFRFR